MSLYINSLHTQAYKFTFPCIHSPLPIVSRKISSPKGQYETVSYGVLNPFSFSLNNSCVLNGNVLKREILAKGEAIIQKQKEALQKYDLIGYIEFFTDSYSI